MFATTTALAIIIVMVVVYYTDDLRWQETNGMLTSISIIILAIAVVALSTACILR